MNTTQSQKSQRRKTNTLIQVSKETAKKLKSLGDMSMTYDIVINMLIDKFYKGAK
jgi:hypothetical protein